MIAMDRELRPYPLVPKASTAGTNGTDDTGGTMLAIGGNPRLPVPTKASTVKIKLKIRRQYICL